MLYASISCQALKLHRKLNHLCLTKTLHGMKTENDKMKTRKTVGFHNVNKWASGAVAFKIAQWLHFGKVL